MKISRKENKVEVLDKEGNSSLLSVEEARKLSANLLQIGIEIEGIESHVKDWQRIPMQYIALEASKGTDECEVGCWIKDQTKKNALRIVAADLEEIEWHIKEVFEQEETTIENYEENEEDLEFYRQALLDGEVYVFYQNEEDA